MFTATASLPTPDPGPAVAELRRQLRDQLTARDVTPDWSTLSVAGPVEAVGGRGRVWYRWTATVGPVVR